MSNRVILDASALLAVLNSEEGSQAVSKVLPGAVISAVNFSEVVGKLTDAGLPEGPLRAALSSLSIFVQPFDEQSAYIAGLLVKETKRFRLSLGDRACLALALQLSLRVLTTDRDWKKLKLGLQIEVVR